MKKVTVYQAKDGQKFDTPKECADHDKKLKLAPAIEAFSNKIRTDRFSATGVSSANDDADRAIYIEDLAEFIAAHSEELTKALTEPLIVRRPRKVKKPAGAEALAEAGSHA